MTAKRLLDLALVLPGLVLLAPLLLAVALAVRVRLGPGVFFRQERPGLHGRPFVILKFRTMLPGPGPDAERLTPFGRFLRSTSLDELPELFNVLAGHMSLVGPRPLLMQYLPRYTREQARRHEVLPGLSGWAQINGRNALTWEEKFALDVWYVDNRSLKLDLTILARTVLAVLRREGVSAAGEATMPEFMGAERPGPEFMGTPPMNGAKPPD
ncbi:MAG: sugar transferase [Humidesulfovibrio sp.]|nr:hypothetical protein [Desulfovibrio sp.]MDO9082506.1 sugar transferase [Humidesulfovibrio sp.]